jgi:hypothetical protein
MSAIILSGLRVVEDLMSGHDASHDLDHARRVVGYAQQIAHATGLCHPEDPVLLLGAATHDGADHKYEDPEAKLKLIRMRLSEDWDESIVAQVMFIIIHVSWSKERRDGFPECASELAIRLRIIQHADRIEATGYRGFLRCRAFQLDHNPGASHSEILALIEAHAQEKLYLLAPTLDLIPVHTRERLQAELVEAIKDGVDVTAPIINLFPDL